MHRAPCLPSVVFPVWHCNALFAYLLSLTRAFDNSPYNRNCKTMVSIMKRTVSLFIYVCLAVYNAGVSRCCGAEAARNEEITSRLPTWAEQLSVYIHFGVPLVLCLQVERFLYVVRTLK